MTLTPTADRLRLRLDDRQRWFSNEWFFRWYSLKSPQGVSIDLFDGQTGTFGGVNYAGSVSHIFWDAIVRGARREVIQQLEWVEENVRRYSQIVAERAIVECASLLIGFVSRLRKNAAYTDARLRGDGFNIPSEFDAGAWVDLSSEDILAQTLALKAALFPSKDRHAPTEVEDHSQKKAKIGMQYQVALSFAGEQRAYVEQVARALRAKGVVVFYDDFETANIWGEDGVEFLHDVYAKQSDYVAMFISREYVAKNWTRHERRAAPSRAITEDRAVVLPIRFDDSEVPGLPSTVLHVHANDYAPAALASLICQKIGVSSGKLSDIPSPRVASWAGEATFDYTAHNGSLILGPTICEFETKWSSGGSNSL